MGSEQNTSLAVIWVHYHTPELLTQSVDAMEAETRGQGVSAEFIVVDNGGLGEWSTHESLLSCRIIPNETNRGYAGGINDGVTATAADTIIVLNPDVLVLPGCVSELMQALQSFAIAGPAMFLDKNRRFCLPPTEKRDFLSALLGAVADGSPFWAARARKRWRRHVRQVQRDGKTTSRAYELSGAILAFSRQAWNLLGRWDEGYQLYFEETEWLTRAETLGLKAAYVGEAKCIHLYAQSTTRSGLSSKWFSASAVRFERSHFHNWQRGLLRFSRQWAASRRWNPACSPGSRVPERATWLELSNTPRGYPAARARLQETLTIDDALNLVPGEQLPQGTYWLRSVDIDNNDLQVIELKVAG